MNRFPLISVMFRFSLMAIAFNLPGCASNDTYTVELMPASVVHEKTSARQPSSIRDSLSAEPGRVFYATDRKPNSKLNLAPYYTNERGFVMRLGRASFDFNADVSSALDLSEISVQKDRTSDIGLNVASVTEFGVLSDTTIPWMAVPSDKHGGDSAGAQFAMELDEVLAESNNKDIFIYVHGVKTVFENPVLVVAELWHFLGYDGAPIAYSWPSTPERLAYVSDIEAAVSSARNFRIFLNYLARETMVERIHIIGYSAGTRLVTTALSQIALSGTAETDTKIANVILVSSDFDGEIFAGYLLDGMLDVAERTTLYTSSKDNALGISEWLFRRRRLGQFSGALSDSSVQFLEHFADKLQIVDVTGAPNFSTGDGHGYFLRSAWVSGDILALLRYGAKPADRGLEKVAEQPVWAFPPNYIPQIRDALLELEP